MDTKYVIITPVRNEEAYLRFTIESVISQHVTPIEWVIVNDGSTDGTRALLKEFERAQASCDYEITVQNGRALLSPHGIRATGSTVLNEIGFRPDVIESQLAHQERNMTRASYNQAEYLQERREMMQAWADFLFPNAHCDFKDKSNN